jgi:hypothetical protein
MTPAALHGLFRSEMVDTVEPYLWSDTEVYAYLDDAQTMLCRLTDGIPDAYQSALRIAVVAATEWYALSPLILKIRTATFADTGRPVSVFNPETAADNNVIFDGREGPVAALVLGLRENSVRVWPVPNSAQNIELSVFRLPLTSITGANGETFEVDAQHHYHLLLWAKSLAYLKQDSDTFSKSRSEDFETRFRNYCEEVKRQQSRSRRITGTTTYGGL